MNRATTRPAGPVGANAAARIQFFDNGTVTLWATGARSSRACKLPVQANSAEFVMADPGVATT